MLSEPTREKLHAMKLHGMAEAWEEGASGFVGGNRIGAGVIGMGWRAAHRV